MFGGGVVQALESGKRRPSWIDGSLMLVARIVQKPRPTLWAQAEAIVLTDRLER